MKRVGDNDLDFVDYAVFYNGDVYTGEAIETDKDGNIIALTTYEQGFEHGPSKEWYSSGQIREEGMVEMDKGAVGTWRSWHENGRLAKETVFDDRGRRLADREWDTDGHIVKDKAYSDPV